MDGWRQTRDFNGPTAGDESRAGSHLLECTAARGRESVGAHALEVACSDGILGRAFLGGQPPDSAVHVSVGWVTGRSSACPFAGFSLGGLQVVCRAFDHAPLARAGEPSNTTVLSKARSVSLAADTSWRAVASEDTQY